MQTHHIVQLTETGGPGLRAVGIRGAISMGHVLNIDHFPMSRPTFPPHPHAGFSAVTYMLPRSPGSFINRDSRGDRSLIAAGDLHWTLAGSGILHEALGTSGRADFIASGAGLHLITGHSQPLDSPVYWSGPFCLSDPARLRAAHERYQSGAMGALSPSS